MKFLEEYPNKPPVVKFVTKLFHPNSQPMTTHRHRQHPQHARTPRSPSRRKRESSMRSAPLRACARAEVLQAGGRASRRCLTFARPLFHCVSSVSRSVYTDGAICLDILANQWSPIYDVAAILASIQSLLTDPNPNSPANVEAAKLYVENRREYDRKVGEVIEGLWKLEEAERDAEGGDDEDEEEEEEDADAAPRKKQKLTETTALNSNAPAPSSTTASTTPAAATSSASASAPPVAAAAPAAAAQ
jgi:ubiquitin-protein ligase